MYQDDSKGHLLASHNGEDHVDLDTNHCIQPSRRKPSQNRIAILAISLLFLSLLGNAFQVRQFYALQRHPERCRSRFSGLGHKTPTPYRIHTEFSSHNRTVADSLWEALDSSPIVVALSDTYAQAHGLDLSARFPWDHAKGIYHIKAFHHMHCLKNIRKAYIDYQRGEPPLIEPEHFHHCIDTLRQDLMCLADDTPMPTINELHKIGNGQVRQCRDWDRLIAWTQEPERHACFRMLSDYRQVPHTLEQFAYCDKGSPYRAVADQYFEQWGHKDPFGE